MMTVPRSTETLVATSFPSGRGRLAVDVRRRRGARSPAPSIDVIAVEKKELFLEDRWPNLNKTRR